MSQQPRPLRLVQPALERVVAPSSTDSKMSTKPTVMARSAKPVSPKKHQQSTILSMYQKSDTAEASQRAAAATARRTATATAAAATALAGAAKLNAVQLLREYENDIARQAALKANNCKNASNLSTATSSSSSYSSKLKRSSTTAPSPRYGVYLPKDFKVGDHSMIPVRRPTDHQPLQQQHAMWESEHASRKRPNALKTKPDVFTKDNGAAMSITTKAGDDHDIDGFVSASPTLGESSLFGRLRDENDDDHHETLMESRRRHATNFDLDMNGRSKRLYAVDRTPIADGTFVTDFTAHSLRRARTSSPNHPERSQRELGVLEQALNSQHPAIYPVMPRSAGCAGSRFAPRSTGLSFFDGSGDQLQLPRQQQRQQQRVWSPTTASAERSAPIARRRLFAFPDPDSDAEIGEYSITRRGDDEANYWHDYSERGVGNRIDPSALETRRESRTGSRSPQSNIYRSALFESSSVQTLAAATVRPSIDVRALDVRVCESVRRATPVPRDINESIEKFRNDLKTQRRARVKQSPNRSSGREACTQTPQLGQNEQQQQTKSAETASFAPTTPTPSASTTKTSTTTNNDDTVIDTSWLQAVPSDQLPLLQSLFQLMHCTPEQRVRLSQSLLPSSNEANNTSQSKQQKANDGSSSNTTSAQWVAAAQQVRGCLRESHRPIFASNLSALARHLQAQDDRVDDEQAQAFDRDAAPTDTTSSRSQSVPPKVRTAGNTAKQNDRKKGSDTNATKTKRTAIINQRAISHDPGGRHVSSDSVASSLSNGSSSEQRLYEAITPKQQPIEAKKHHHQHRHRHHHRHRHEPIQKYVPPEHPDYKPGDKQRGPNEQTPLLYHKNQVVAVIHEIMRTRVLNRMPRSNARLGGDSSMQAQMTPTSTIMTPLPRMLPARSRQGDQATPVSPAASGSASTRRLDPAMLDMRLLTEIVYQLEQRMFNFIFGIKPANRRPAASKRTNSPYTYEARDFAEAMVKYSTDTTTDVLSENDLEVYRNRHEYLMLSFEKVQYNEERHVPRAVAFINRYGMYDRMPVEPELHFNSLTSFTLLFEWLWDHVEVKERSFMAILFTCLLMLSLDDGRPLFCFE